MEVTGQELRALPGHETVKEHSAMTTRSDPLSATLRAWRQRLTAEQAGLIPGRDRRTSGLRREELAILADVSVDYVIRLEQGRARPSEQVVSALTRALMLSTDERDHLYRLAGYLPPAPGRIPHHLTPGVQRMITRLADTAICVYAADWTLLAWTPLWAALMGDLSTRDPRRLNLLRVIFRRSDANPNFGDHPTRVLVDPTEYRAELVADLRAATGRYPDDPGLAALIKELQASPEFCQLWDRGSVTNHSSTRKVITHPLGEITVDCDKVTDTEADLRILTYTAPAGTRDAELLEFLRVSRPARLSDHLTG